MLYYSLQYYVIRFCTRPHYTTLHFITLHYIMPDFMLHGALYTTHVYTLYTGTIHAYFIDDATLYWLYYSVLYCEYPKFRTQGCLSVLHVRWLLQRTWWCHSATLVLLPPLHVVLEI